MLTPLFGVFMKPGWARPRRGPIVDKEKGKSSSCVLKRNFMGTNEFWGVIQSKQINIVIEIVFLVFAITLTILHFTRYKKNFKLKSFDFKFIGFIGLISVVLFFTPASAHIISFFNPASDLIEWIFLSGIIFLGSLFLLMFIIQWFKNWKEFGLIGPAMAQTFEFNSRYDAKWVKFVSTCLWINFLIWGLVVFCLGLFHRSESINSEYGLYVFRCICSVFELLAFWDLKSIYLILGGKDDFSKDALRKSSH